MKRATFKIYFPFLLAFAFAMQLKAQDFSVDYNWPHLDRLQIVTCRDDGFACLSSSVRQFQKHSIIKFSAEGKLVFRYDAVPEKMFSSFMKKGETWNRKIFELGNGNLVVLFSAAKEGRCPVDLYYYIVNPAGKLIKASNVSFNNYKSSEIENPALDNAGMVNDNEFVLSVSHGGSCKEIFNNSATNKNFLFNINTGAVTALHDLDGHRVVNCITGNNSIYLLTLPIRFYKNDQGVKSEVNDRLYHLWKFSNSFEKQQHFSLWQYPENNTYMEQMKLQGNYLQVFFCQRIIEHGEYGYQLFDKETLITGKKKSFKTELYPHDVYAAHDKYFLQDSKVITDATGEDMIFFHVEAAKKSGYGDDKTIHAQVVQDGMIRNEKMITVLEEKRTFAVSQPNSKGTYIMASDGSPKNFLGNFYTDPLLVYSYEGFKFDEAERTAERRKAIESMKKRLVKTPSIPEGTPLEITEMDKKDLYSIKNTVPVEAGKYLMRRGDGFYTGYVKEENGNTFFVYGAKFFPGTAFKKKPPVATDKTAADKKEKENKPAARSTAAKTDKQNPPKASKANSGEKSILFKDLNRSRSFTIKLLSSQLYTSGSKERYEKYIKDSLQKTGLSEQALDRIGALMNAFPLDKDEIDDEIASEWTAYNIADIGDLCLLWIPQYENSNMNEDYRPTDEDGFFIFVSRDYEPTEKNIEESRKRCRVTNMESLKGPKKAVMDGKTRYLDGLDRSRPFTISYFTNKRNNGMDRGSFIYYLRAYFLNKGINRAGVDKLGNILNALSIERDKIDDSIAKQWKAYIIAETGHNYLVWVPQDENMHMPEAYRPGDPDGFTVFMSK